MLSQDRKPVLSLRTKYNKYRSAAADQTRLNLDLGHLAAIRPKRLTISIFITRKKPQHTTVDKVQKKKQKQFSSYNLSIVTAIHQGHLQCVSATIQVLGTRTYKCIYVIFINSFFGEQKTKISNKKSTKIKSHSKQTSPAE